MLLLIVGELPRIVIEPAALTHVRSGEMFVLSCQAVGSPVPRIHWVFNGQRLPRDHNMPRRVVAFQSGTRHHRCLRVDAAKSIRACEIITFLSYCIQ